MMSAAAASLGGNLMAVDDDDVVEEEHHLHHHDVVTTADVLLNDDDDDDMVVQEEHQSPARPSSVMVDDNGMVEPARGMAATTDDVGLAVLSEEQTNVALAALQETSAVAIEAAASTKEEYRDFEPSNSSSPKQEPLEVETTTTVSRKRKMAASQHESEAAAVKSEETNSADDTKPPPATKPRRAAPQRVSWESRMEMLREYKEKHGTLLIPIRYKQNPSLGKFVHNTREQYKLFHNKTKAGYKKKCSLTAERIAELEEIGFVFSTERTKRQNEDWESRFEQLKAYKEEHGDCLVPHGYKEDPSFAEWIHRQRTTHAGSKDKSNPLVQERMQKLVDIGFVFTVHSDKWMDHWNQLSAYKEKHGHCQVPTHYAEDPKLGRWVHTQRHQRRLQLKGKKSCMTPDRVELLNSLEFAWEVRPSLERPRATWQQRLEELREFHAQHQHFCVPANLHPALHSWCQEQKQRLRNVDKFGGKDSSKRMGPDRILALAQLGFTKDVTLAFSPSPEAKENDDVQQQQQQSVPGPDEIAAAAAAAAAAMPTELSDKQPAPLVEEPSAQQQHQQTQSVEDAPRGVEHETTLMEVEI